MGEDVRRVGAFSVLLFALSCSLIINLQTVEAEELMAGVKPGDWVKYRSIYNFTTTNPGDLSSNRFEVYYGQVEVFSVMGYRIGCRWTFHDKNGTEILVDEGYMDARVFGYIIAANLSVGDPILHPKMDVQINATVKTKCLGVERELNWVGPISFNYENEQFHSLHWGWDRASGILVEASNCGEMHTSDYVTIMISQTKIIDTNIWEINVIPSDLDRDNYVGISDIVICAEAFGSDLATHSIRWNSYCDVDQDGRVGIDDLLTIARHFGESA